MQDNFSFELSTVLPVTVAIFFGLSIALAIAIEPSKFKESRFYNLIEIIAPMSILLICINMFTEGLSLDLTRKQQRFELYRDSMADIHINVENELLSLYKDPVINSSKELMLRPEFYASFYSGDLKIYETHKHYKTHDTNYSAATERYICMRMLQAFQNYLQYNEMRNISDPSWIAVFLQWGQSKYFQEYFETLKVHFMPSTVEFASIIFENSKKIPIPNTDSSIYLKLGTEVNKSEAVQRIYQAALNDKL